MAIRINIDSTPVEHWQDVRIDHDIDVANLKLRLALEGMEITTPVHGNLIRVSHPQHGMTHFNSWGTILDHCNENWKTTYWGPSFYGGYDADSRADSGSGGLPVSTSLQRT
jgi:hypothetical protein